MLIACPNCQGKVSDAVAVCPHCGAPLLKPVPCRTCGTPIAPGEAICPACNTELGAPPSLRMPAPESSPSEQDKPASIAPPPPAPKQPFTFPPIVKKLAIVAAVMLGLAALSTVAYFAFAKTDEQCRREASCEQAGLCTATFQSCIAATFGDCAKAQNCLEYGECTARDGKCVVASASDCSAICKTSDRCVARDGRCVCDPTRSVSCLEIGKCGVDEKGWCTSFTSDGCRKSTRCAQEGLCALASDKAKCIAKDDADCLPSQACKKDGRCVARAGACVRLDCAASEECSVKGRCTLEGRVCKASKDADCAGAEWCKRLGRCKAQDGVCRASAEGCKASDKCKDEGACFVSQDGEACVAEKSGGVSDHEPDSTREQTR